MRFGKERLGWAEEGWIGKDALGWDWTGQGGCDGKVRRMVCGAPCRAAEAPMPTLTRRQRRRGCPRSKSMLPRGAAAPPSPPAPHHWLFSPRSSPPAPHPPLPTLLPAIHPAGPPAVLTPPNGRHHPIDCYSRNPDATTPSIHIHAIPTPPFHRLLFS